MSRSPLSLSEERIREPGSPEEKPLPPPRALGREEAGWALSPERGNIEGMKGYPCRRHPARLARKGRFLQARPAPAHRPRHAAKKACLNAGKRGAPGGRAAL
jgi:hypothetical protein